MTTPTAARVCAGCHQPAPIAARGLCKPCYNHHHRAGTLDTFPKRATAGKTPGVAANPPGMTYRQLDYWIRAGYLHPTNPNGGSGSVRHWDDTELAVAAAMARAVRAGLPPPIAARVARTTDGRLQLAPGVFVEVLPTDTVT